MSHNCMQLLNSLDLVIFLPFGRTFVYFRVDVLYSVNLFLTRIVNKTQPITVQCALLQLKM
jgi:hypothetical protein